MLWATQFELDHAIAESFLIDDFGRIPRQILIAWEGDLHVCRGPALAGKKMIARLKRFLQSLL